MASSEDVAIKISNVSKSFKLPHEKHSSIKGLFVNMFKSKRTYEKQQVLNDISFDIKKGEFFGIVGRNGSGKSTLLKLLAGIYTPDKGHIQINGKLTPFIELGVGFNPELTGRENVFLNGALLGFNRKEMEAMYDEIVEFAELNKFMDQKLKNYSSGMQVRLAFSIAIRANTDILVLDEVLAVGDESFQRKCFQYFGSLKKNKKTVVLVTHDMNAAQRFCTRAVMLSEGRIKKIGNVSSVANEYSRMNLEKISIEKSGESRLTTKEDSDTRYGSGGASISFETYNENQKICKIFSPEEKIIVRAKIDASRDLVDPRVGIMIQDSAGLCVFATNTLVKGVKVPNIKRGDSFIADFTIDNIYTDGAYVISGAIASNLDETIYSRVEESCDFTSGGWRMKHALAHPKHSIKFKRIS